jgi:hypothetical protein
MIQIVENHRLIRERGFAAGVSHSIGGPINNNVVVLLERTGHYQSRDREPYKPWGLPSLGRMKPKNVTLEALLSSGAAAQGSFVTTTARFNYKSGRPEALIVVVACHFEGGSYKFLFGVDGEYYDQVSAFKGGDPVTVERVDGSITVNRMPVRKLYTRTINGLVELGEKSWNRLTKNELKSKKQS